MSKNEKHFKDLIGDLNIDTQPSDSHRKKLKDKMLSAFDRAKKSQQRSANTHPPQTYRRTIMNNSIAKMAVAAVIIIAAGVGIATWHNTTQQKKTELAVKAEPAVITTKDTPQAIAENPLEKIERMFAAGDVDGLITMLRDDDYAVRVAAANYLALIGDANAIAPLTEQGDQWSGDGDNPFAAAIESIDSPDTEEAPATTAAVAPAAATATAPDGQTAKNISSDLLKLIPAETMYCVRVNNLDYTVNLLDQFLAGISPAPMGLSMGARMAMAKVLGSPELGGLNTAGNFAMFSCDPNGIPNLLIPVTDFNEFITGNPNCSTPDANGVFKIAASGISTMLAKPLGQYVLIEFTKDYKKLTDTAKAIADGSNKGLGSVLNEAEVKLAASEPLWAYGSVQVVSKNLGPMMFAQIEKTREMIKNQQGDQQMNMENIVDMYVALLKTLMAETKHVSISVKPQPDVLNIHETITAMPGTDMANIFVAGPAVNLRLGYFTDHAVFNIGGNINKSSDKLFYNKCFDLFIAMASDTMTDQDIDKFRTMIDDLMDSLGNSFAISYWSDTTVRPPFVEDFAVEISNVEKFNKTIDDFMDLWDSNGITEAYENMGLRTEYTITRQADNYREISIDSSKFVMKAVDANTQQGQMIEEMYGDGLDSKWAIVNGLCVGSVSADASEVIKELIDLTKSGKTYQMPPEVETALEMLPNPQSADFVGTLNYIRLLDMALSMQPFASDWEFSTQTHVAFAGAADNGRLNVDIAVPKEHILEIIEAFKTLQQGPSPEQIATARREAIARGELDANSPIYYSEPVIPPNDSNVYYFGGMARVTPTPARASLDANINPDEVIIDQEVGNYSISQFNLNKDYLDLRVFTFDTNDGYFSPTAYNRLEQITLDAANSDVNMILTFHAPEIEPQAEPETDWLGNPQPRWTGWGRAVSNFFPTSGDRSLCYSNIGTSKISFDRDICAVGFTVNRLQNNMTVRLFDYNDDQIGEDYTVIKNDANSNHSFFGYFDDSRSEIRSVVFGLDGEPTQFTIDDLAIIIDPPKQ